MSKPTKDTSKPKVSFSKRDGSKYYFSWKIPSGGYDDGQKYRYRIKTADMERKNTKWGDWTTKEISKSKTEIPITLDPKYYYPYHPDKKTVVAIEVNVKGKRKEDKKNKYSWSDWGEVTYTVPKPNPPSLTVTNNTDHQTTFSWNANASDSSGPQCVDCYYQSYLVEGWNKEAPTLKDFTNTNNKYTDPINAPSSSVKYYDKNGKVKSRNIPHAGLNTSKAIPEDSGTLSNGKMHTRIFRVITRGVGGYSDSVSKKNLKQYAYGTKPPTATWTDDPTIVKPNPDGSVTLTVKWKNNVTSKNGNPIRAVSVQYVVTTPGRYLVIPSGVSGWNTVSTFDDKGPDDALRFTVPAGSLPGKDQAMYVQIVTTSAIDASYSIALRVEELPVVLKSPTLTSVTTDDQTKRATVTATNNSEVPGSFLKVYGKATNAQDDHELGVIEEGETSVTVDWSILDGQGAKTFGVRAFVYDESGQEQLASSEKIIYQGGTVPEAPTNVDASQDSANPDTILISWDWTWTEANGVELSWSEDKMAWESTNGPSTYEISNLKPNHWRISGLNMGTKWWVRVRLIKTVGDNAVYGSYSEPVSVELYTTPSTPYLHLSDTVVPQDGTVTATWAYTSQDGSAQSNAIICEVTRSNGVISYGQEVGRVADSTQRIIIEPAKVSGWCTGSTAETHELALNVQSETGKTANWSEPVSLTIAKKPTASIASPPTTSLVYDTIKMGEITRSGDEVVFNYGDVPPTIENVEMDIVPQISGSGTPSPTNVRTITGYNSVTLTDTDIYENEETYSVAMPNADKPVYAGHLNMTTGALRIDKTVLEFDGTENWSKVGDYLLLDISDETFSVNEDLFGDRYVYDPNHYAANAFSVENSSTNNYVGYGVVGTMTVV